MFFLGGCLRADRRKINLDDPMATKSSRILDLAEIPLELLWDRLITHPRLLDGQKTSRERMIRA